MALGCILRCFYGKVLFLSVIWILDFCCAGCKVHACIGPSQVRVSAGRSWSCKVLRQRNGGKARYVECACPLPELAPRVSPRLASFIHS